MLLEALTALAAQAPLSIAGLGLRRRAAATWSRGRRCAQAWSEHLAQSRAAALAVATGGRRCLVLGSGALRDAPTAELARRYQRVTLVDVVHPLNARILAATRRNIELATVDVTGVLAGLKPLRPSQAAPAPSCDAFLDDDAVDAVISLNLASQLALPAMAWLEARCGWDAAASGDYGRAIIAAHFTYLRSFRAAVALISDHAIWEYDADDRRSPPEDSLAGCTPTAAPLRRWEWRLAPPGEMHPSRGVGLSVGCWDRAGLA